MIMHPYRDDLPPLPLRMYRLPRDHRGFPVPWFVQWLQDGKACTCGTGEPDFRVIDSAKLVRAVKSKRCWCCGEPLGRHLAFVIGPMCALNRVISEPPSHRECAEFSAKACPFLSRPRMRRNEKDLPSGHFGSAGFHLDRNPGAVCVWITRSYRTFRPHAGKAGVLFELGEPEEVLWFAQGRAATRQEVLTSIDSGYPSLHAIAVAEGPDAVAALAVQRVRAQTLLPQ